MRFSELSKSFKVWDDLGVRADAPLNSSFAIIRITAKENTDAKGYNKTIFFLHYILHVLSFCNVTNITELLLLHLQVPMRLKLQIPVFGML